MEVLACCLFGSSGGGPLFTFNSSHSFANLSGPSLSAFSIPPGGEEGRQAGGSCIPNAPHQRFICSVCFISSSY